MYRLFIALRYLLHKRINILAIIGVAISVAVLFVVHSVMTGFAQQIQSYVRGNLSDLTVERFGEQAFAGYEENMAKLEKMPHVVAVSPRLEGLALVKLGDRDEYRWARFEGIDLARECQTTQLAAYWRKAEQQLHQEDPDHVIVEQPTWGTVTKTNVSPAIVGIELTVLGHDPYGVMHSLGVGDKVVLVTASTGGLERELLPCVISGKFKSGMYEYDNQTVMLPLADAQDFLRKRGRVTSIAIHLDDFRNAREVQAAILGIPTLEELLRWRELLKEAGKLADPPVGPPAEATLTELRRNYTEWHNTANPLFILETAKLVNAYADVLDRLRSGGVLDKFSGRDELASLVRTLANREKNSLGRNYRVQTWEDKQRTLMRAVDIERGITVIVQSFVFLLTWALIYSILSSAVVEKIKDIGILRSLGATKQGVMSIFLLNGFIVGFVGSVIGVIGGTLFCDNINQIADQIYRLTGLRVFPPDVYYFDKIPVDSNPTEWAIVITSVALVVSVAGAFIPAYKAAKLNPVDALRYE